MSSDTIHDRYRLRVEALKSSSVTLRTLQGQLQSELSLREKEVSDLTRRIDILAKVSELLRLLMDRLVMGHVRSIESVVTEGIQTIFSDQDLSFEAEIGSWHNKVAIDFFLKQEGGSTPVKGDPLEAFGGGPASIASLILRVLAMHRLKKWPILALDETLAAVSDEYVDQTGKFLRELTDKMGLPLLLVTHKQAFLDHAKVAYKATEKVEDDGTRHLRLHRETRHA